MLKIENTEVTGWESALRGMRNPLNSWARADTAYRNTVPEIGQNDLQLMNKLASAGPVHAKYRRMIVVYADITAPLYWWKQFDTYKVGTISNSCSTMHKIADSPITMKDFSAEHLGVPGRAVLKNIVDTLDYYRETYTRTQNKADWWQIIQLLPESYNQRRTIMINYENLSAMYRDRRNHKLDEWHVFCDWVENLPYSEVITGGAGSN